MKFNLPRRIFMPLLCLILLLSLVPSALADTHDPDGAREAILQAYEDLAAAEGLGHTIDLEQYAITVAEMDELIVSTGIAGDCLQPWYLSNYEYTYDVDTDIVLTLTLKRLDPNVYDYGLYERKMAEILAVTVYEGMTDWQKALSIHDYLATHIIYDETLTYREDYDAIVRGTSVCSGYALAYMYLLQRVGIDCRYVSSKEMDHAWNLVLLDGNWYHADATWDDPTSDVYGRCRHHYFLLSDEAIADEDHGHYNWDITIECPDTSLDSDRFWQEIESPICYESADVCYFREQTGDTGYTIYRRDREGNQTVIATTDAGHIDIGGDDDYLYFYGNYGLDLVGDTLYYADMTAVYSIKTDGSGQKTVYSHDYEANKTCIMGSHVDGNTLYLTLRDHEGNQSTMQLDLGDENHIHSYTGQTVEPTCAEQGYTLYTCQCGVSYKSDLTAKKEHTFDGGTVIQEATLSEKGIKRCTCTVCGEHKDLEIPILAVDGNNPLTDADGVDEEEYLIRRIIVGAGVVVLGILFGRRKRRK